MTGIRYRRLPGKQRTAWGTVSLYLAPDHILQVRSTRLTEEYERFYLRDVQSIAIRKSAPFHYGWAVIFVLLALITARLSLLWALGVIATAALFLWLRGPACVCHLRTAITDTRLSSLHRLKTAVRVLQMLVAEIEGVQGKIIEFPAVSPEPPPLNPVLAPRPSLPEATPQRSVDHIVLLVFLLAEAALAGLWLAAGNVWLGRALAIATMIEFLTIVTVLVRQIGKGVERPLQLISLVAMARWLIVQMVVTLAAYKALLVDRTIRSVQPFSVRRGWEAWLTLSSLVVITTAGFVLANRRRPDDPIRPQAEAEHG